MSDLSQKKENRLTDRVPGADDSKKQTTKPIAAPRKSTHKMESESATESELSDWESRPFGSKVLMSPPLVKGGGDKSPLGSPPKRSYPPHFTSGLDSTEFNQETYPKRKPHFPWDPEKENKYSANWNNSVSSRDSAISGSLFSAFGSALTESTSSFESASNTEDTASNLSSPTHSVYGRYQKKPADDKGSESESGGSDTEVLVLHRLPGENLGMILGIDKGDDDKRVSKVFVKTVTIGGAAHRATGGTRGIQVGDEILQINGTDINTLTYDECMSVLKEMPLRVILSVKRSKSRAVQRSPAASIKSLSTSSYQNGHSSSQFSESSCYSESEDDSTMAGEIEGFTLHRAEIDKDPEESLGLSIVPSYGSTRQYYQIKRLLPSGAASRSGQLKVGDRLVSCNGHSLRSVSQQQCLSILKAEANNGDLEIEVLRQTEDSGQCLEISVQVPNRAGIAGGDSSTLTLRSPNFGKKEFILSEVAETDSDNDVVLNKYSFLKEQPRFDKQTQELNGRGVVGSYPSESTENGNLTLNSSISSTEYSKTKNMDDKESADNWAFAVPPPAEFSSFEPAVPPPVEFSEGQSPIFNQSSNENAPVTNIDDILTNYPEAPSEFNQPMKSVQSVDESDRDKIDMVADVVGLEEKVWTHSSLPQINEIPSECSEENVVRDIKTEQSGHLSKKKGETDKRIISSDTNINGFAQTNDDGQLGTDEDGDLIVPVSVSRNKLEVVMSTIPKASGLPRASSPDIEEETIVPDFKTRVNSAPSVKSVKSVVSEASEQRPVSPIMEYKPRQQKQSSVLPDSDDENHVAEEAVMPVKVTREEGGKVLEQKLGRDIEETIVKSEVTRDSSWSPAKLIMITNAWSKSAAQNKGKDTNVEGGSKTFKSVVGVFNSKKDDKTKEISVDKTKKPDLDDVDKKETAISEKTKESKATPQNDNEEVCVQNGQQRDSNKLGNIADKKESAISTIKIGSNVGEAVPPQDSKDQVSKQAKSDSVKEEPVMVSKPEIVKPEKPEEKDTHNSTSTSTQFKTTVSVAKPHSLLGTVRSQNAPSQMKPLSSIKPLTVSAKTFSLGKPGKYSTTISTGSGKPSLLSTIHGSSLTSQSKNTRSEDEPFLISILKGILGIGMKVATTPDGAVQVMEIQNNGPISKDGNVRVGDYILAINNTELTGLQDHKVQQIIRLLPRGIAKILVSAKPPEECAKGDSSLSVNTSSPLSTPSTASPRSPLEAKTSPRGSGGSPALSPRQPAKPLVTTPVLHIGNKKLDDKAGKVTVKHDQSQVSKVDSSAEAPSKDDFKVPTVTAKKPSASGPGNVDSSSSSGHRIGGYVSSALDRKHSFENKPPTVMDRPRIHPRKADYVSSASKVDKPDKEKEPIDTVIFASINPTKSTPESSARKSLGEVSSYDLKKPQPEPRIIPKGQIDYVSSEKPKKAPPPVSPRSKDISGGSKSKDIPLSPYAYEEPANKKMNPGKLNSALSPRRQSQEGAFNFGTSFGKGSEIKGNTLSSPTSPVASPHTPEMSPSKSSHTPPAVSPKPSVSPRNKHPVIKSLSHEEHDQHSTTPTVTKTEDATKESTDALQPQPETSLEVHNQNTVPETSSANLNEAEGKIDVLVDVTGTTTNILDDNTLLSPVLDTDSLLMPCTVQNVEATNVDADTAQTAQTDNLITEVNGSQDSVEDCLGKQHEDDEMLKVLAEEIVKTAIQNGIEAIKREQSEIVDDDSDGVHSDLSNTEGKSNTQLHASVAGSGCEGHSPKHVMDTSPLRAFLEKIDDLPSEPPALPQNEPPTLSQNEPPALSTHENNAVAESIANEMVTDSYEINAVAGNIANEMVTDYQNESETSLSDIGAKFSNIPETAGLSPSDNLMSDSCMPSDVVPPAIPACSVVMDTADSAEPQHVLEISNSDIHESSNTRESPSQQEADVLGSPENRTSKTIEDSEAISEPVHSETLSDIQNSVMDIENKISAVENVLKPKSNISPEDISQKYEQNFSEELAVEEEITLPDNTLDESEDLEIPNRKSLDSVDGQSESSDYSGITSRRKWAVTVGGKEIEGDELKTLNSDSLSPDRLSKLLDEANATMDQTGESADDKIMVILLHRDPSVHQSIGLKLAAGPNAEVLVSAVDRNSLTASEGQITPGDRIMSVNGETLTSENTESLLTSLDRSDDEIVLVVSKGVQEVAEQTAVGKYENGSENQIPDSEAEATSRTVVVENIVADDADVTECSNMSVPETKPPPLPSEDEDIGDSTADESKVANSEPNVSQDSKERPMPSKEDISNSSTDTFPDSKTDGKISTRPISIDTISPPAQVNGQSSDSGNETPVSPLSPLSTLSIESDDSADDGPREVMEVTMVKGVTGLGFLIEGGKGSPKGDVPLTIRRIFKGGPAEKCGQLKVKDEILKVNGEDITHMKHSAAWTHLKFLDDGEVKLLVKRKVAQ